MKMDRVCSGSLQQITMILVLVFTLSGPSTPPTKSASKLENQVMKTMKKLVSSVGIELFCSHSVLAV